MTNMDLLLDVIGERDNHVFLRGRLADAVVDRDLPSGDVLTTFRLTVSRPPGGRALVDSLECVSVLPKVRRVLERVEPGTELVLSGALQRRFWRSPSGPASRYAVDVESLRVVRSGRRADASRARKPASA